MDHTPFDHSSSSHQALRWQFCFASASSQKFGPLDLKTKLGHLQDVELQFLAIRMCGSEGGRYSAEKLPF